MKLTISIFAVVLALFPARFARAVSIDGLTPEGTIQQVGVTDNGYLDVNVFGSSTSALTVTIVGPLPIPVSLSTSTSNPVVVQGTVPVTIQGGNITASVMPSTTTANLSGQGSQSGSGSGFQVLPANSSRYQSTIINTCGIPGSACQANLYVGPSTLSTSTGYLIPPGGTYSPDGPASFQGELYGASTATVTWAWISH